jgi:hypothetical protein
MGGATSITSQLITTGKVDWRSVGAGAFEAVAAQTVQDMKLGPVGKAFADGLVGAGAAAIRKQDVLAGAFVGVANSYVSQKNPTGATKYLAQGLIGAGTAKMNRQDVVAGFIGGGVGTMVGDYLPTAMEKMGVDPMDVGQPRESGKEAAQAFARATALRDSLLNVIAGDIGSGVAKAVANWAGRDMNVAGMIGSGAASQAYDATVQAGREEARKKDIKVNNAAVATKGPYAAPSILQTNSAEDLRAMGYGDLPAGTRLLVNPEEVALEGSGGIQNAGTAPNDDKIAEKIKADQSRVKEIFVDNPSPSAEELILGRRLLHSYGYRTGALEDEITAKNLSVDDKVALLRGEGAGSLKYAKGSAEEFIANDLDELRERNAIFANPSGGVITRQMEDGTSRSIRFSFDQSAAKLAEGIGVSFEEARAKTDWRAYNNVIDAAFNTEDVTSLRFVGLWRPTKELFHSYFADSKEAKFEGKTAQQRVAMDAAVRAAAHIGATWSKQHTRGNAIDIDQLNGGAVNNGVVSAGGAWTKQQSTVMGAFTDSLWNQHPSSLLTPWRIYRVNGKPPFIANNNGAGDAFNHRNHIHFGL